MINRWVSESLQHPPFRCVLSIFLVIAGRLYDQIVISHNNVSFGRFDMDEAIKAFLVQLSLFYVFNSSYEYGANNKKTPDNIRHVFQFIFVKFLEMKIKEPSTGTAVLQTKRTAQKVNELFDKFK